MYLIYNQETLSIFVAHFVSLFPSFTTHQVCACVCVCCALFHSKIFTIKWLNIIYAHVWKKGWHKFPCRNETKQHSTYVPACRSTNFHVIKLNYFIQSAHLKQRLWLSVFFFTFSTFPSLSLFLLARAALVLCAHKKANPKTNMVILMRNFWYWKCI